MAACRAEKLILRSVYISDWMLRPVEYNKHTSDIIYAFEPRSKLAINLLFGSNTGGTAPCTVVFEAKSVLLERSPTSSQICRLTRSRFFRDLSETKM